MSDVQRRQRADGKWEVRWREGGRRRGRTFDRARDADAFATTIRRRQQLGVGMADLLDELTLAEYVEQWWASYALPNLAPATRQVYARMWDRHARPRLGDRPLRQITPAVIADFRAQLERQGAGPATVLKTLTVLQSVLRSAVIEGRIETNPVAAVRKPAQRTARQAEPLTPEAIEQIRQRLGAVLERGLHLETRDSSLVSVLAYAGLRPGEALDLRWRDIGRQTIRVLASKTGRERHVRILPPLACDLAAWRLASGRPPATAHVFARPDGHRWADTDWRNWRRRIFQSVTDDLGITGARPYDLRRSYVSLLIWSGMTVVEVADQAGHSAQTCLKDYARVFAEYDPGQRVPADAAIARARAQVYGITTEEATG